MKNGNTSRKHQFLVLNNFSTWIYIHKIPQSGHRMFAGLKTQFFKNSKCNNTKIIKLLIKLIIFDVYTHFYDTS